MSIVKTVVRKCDNCGIIIPFKRDTYRLVLAGEKWQKGPPIEDMQNVLDLDFCPKCAARIIQSLMHIEEALNIKDSLCSVEE